MHRLRIRENSLRQNQEEPSMKTTIRKRFPILLLAAVLCLFLGGCGAKSLDLNALRQSDGSYDFADIPLGSSVEEAAKALGVSLKEPAYQHDGTDVYQAEGPLLPGRQKAESHFGIHRRRLADDLLFPGGRRGSLRRSL